MILGSASAVPDLEHENTHILAEAGQRVILVDCPGNPTVRLKRAGFDINRVSEIILTHFHPDHVSGFASLLMSMWLLGRKQPLGVYGLEVTLERAKKMMDLYDWDEWPGFYPVTFNPVEREEWTVVIDAAEIRIISSPVDHLVPTIGLRFEFPDTGRVIAYSCDTEPSQSVRRLAENADVLIHEATGPSRGHTTPERAGEIATQAGVGALYLIHYPPQLVAPETLFERARQTFQGPVHVARDFLSISAE
jgi:ribonuclease Z